MADDNKGFDGISYRGETPPPTIFTILFYGLIIWGLVFMGYYLFSGWSSYDEFDQKKKAHDAAVAAKAPTKAAPAVGDMAGILEAGKKAFAERCAACHGADGKGGIGPDLSKKDLKYGKTDANLRESIEKGRPGGMPAFAGQLSHEQTEGLVRYLQSL
jgi:cytochrome c oxidase cbb3-type subunit 3